MANILQTLPPESQTWGRDIEARLRRLETAAKNVDTLAGGTNARLSSTMASVKGLNSTVSFLSHQDYSAEAVPGTLTTVDISPAETNIPDTWVEFDPDADAQLTVTTSESGTVAVQAGGYLAIYSQNYAVTSGFIGVEVLDTGGAQVRAPANGDGNLSRVWSANTQNTTAGSGHRHRWQLAPETTYTFRCRRGYSIGAGSSGAFASISFQGTALSVTLVGM